MSSMPKMCRYRSRELKRYLLIAVIIVAASVALAGQTSKVKAGRSSNSLDRNPQELFQQGEAALKGGDLGRAEKCFRRVLAIDPQSAGAYANLGVVYMRRKQWQPALDALNKADHLAPSVAGIRLNIGLVHYRQNNFRAAIEPFLSVVRDMPNSWQARYLLGLCYFFTERYADAVTVIEPLWIQESSELNYLYVLGIAADESHQAELSRRALDQLVKIGQDSATLHLLLGKAHINREEYDDAIKELELAERADPKLPFLHFNLGVAHLKKQELDRAKAEFFKDKALEPDVAYNYDQLGLIFYQQQKDEEAAQYLQQAVRLDPRLASSHFQLARVYLRQKKYSEALLEIETTEKLAPDGASVHYLHGQALQHLDRQAEARAEMQTFTRLSNAARGRRQKELGEAPIPNPELAGEPQ